MSEADRDKWNERYRAGAYGTRLHPSALLVQHVQHARPGPALDVACGAGRNALFLAEQGFSVDAVDISDVGLQRLQHTARERDLQVNSYCMDLMDADASEFPGHAYSLIVMIRFVSQTLTTRLAELLAPGGILVVEQHLQPADPGAPVDLAGPTSTRFRLPRGALRSWIGAGQAQLEILYDHEGAVTDPDGKTALLAQVVGRRIAD